MRENGLLVQHKACKTKRRPKRSNFAGTYERNDHLSSLEFGEKFYQNNYEELT